MTSTGATITYNFTAAGMTNRAVTNYPAEVIEWNNTHDQLRYDVYSANETWMHFTVDSNFTYQSISPYANVTDLGGGTYNITETYDNTYYQVWFLKEKDTLYTTFHISMWSPNGYSDMPMLGYFWESWQVFYSVGNTFNASNATQIPTPDIDLPLGYNYTFAVLDHFGAVMATQTAIANTQERFVKITVPAYELAISSLSSNDVRMNIYTTSNLSATPITVQVPAGGARYRYLRPTNYTIVASFIQSGTAQYFNVSLSSPLILRINGTTLEQLVAISNNIYQWQQVITDSLTPGMVLAQTNPPYSPDGTRAGGTDPDPLFLDPYQIMWGSISTRQENTTAGAKSLWAGQLNTSLMAGTVTILEDKLFISSTNSSASLMVNTTAGTNIINTTAPPATTYDILADHAAYAGANLTAWTNSSGLIVERNIRFRWAGKFTWYLDENTNKYYTAVTINNTLPLKIWRPYVTISFYPGTNISLPTVSVYDTDSATYLKPGVNYAVDATGISMEFGNLSAGETRTFSIVAYKSDADWNPSSYGSATVRLGTPEFLEYKPGDSRYYAHGEWLNTYPAVYSGDITLIIDSNKTVNPGSVVVYDITNQRTIPNSQWYVNGQAIVITAPAVGSIQPSDKAAYGVYFLYQEDTGAYFGPVLHIGGASVPAAFLPLILGAILLIWGYLTDQKKEPYKQRTLIIAGGAITIITICAIVLMALITQTHGG